MGSVYSQPSRWLRGERTVRQSGTGSGGREAGAVLGGDGSAWSRAGVGAGTKEGPSKRGPSGSLLQEGLGHRQGLSLEEAARG